VLRERRHVPVPVVGEWLARVVAGYFACHAVPTNSPALSAFRYHVVTLWHRQLCRRSQRAYVVWDRMAKLADEFLPKPVSCIPGRACGLPSDIRGRSRVREFRLHGSVQGALSDGRPYRKHYWACPTWSRREAGCPRHDEPLPYSDNPSISDWSGIWAAPTLSCN
jgi:hypothetical protein